MFKGQSVEEQQEAVLVLQEMSTVLMYLASELTDALSSNRKVDPERLEKIARALKSSHKTLQDLSHDADASPGNLWHVPPNEDAKSKK